MSDLVSYEDRMSEADALIEEEDMQQMHGDLEEVLGEEQAAREAAQGEENAAANAHNVELTNHTPLRDLLEELQRSRRNLHSSAFSPACCF